MFQFSAAQVPSVILRVVLILVTGFHRPHGLEQFAIVQMFDVGRIQINRHRIVRIQQFANLHSLGRNFGWTGSDLCAKDDGTARKRTNSLSGVQINAHQNIARQLGCTASKQLLPPTAAANGLGLEHRLRGKGHKSVREDDGTPLALNLATRILQRKEVHT